MQVVRDIVNSFIYITLMPQGCISIMSLIDILYLNCLNLLCIADYIRLTFGETSANNALSMHSTGLFAGYLTNKNHNLCDYKFGLYMFKRLRITAIIQ